MQKLLLFGGSFDPIHHGHLIVARAVAEQLDIPRVVLIPSARPPHKPTHRLAPGAQRLEMCRQAVQGDALFAVSDWEVTQAGPSYTLHTVEHFQQVSPADTQLYWLIGMDSLRELATWYRVGELAALCTLVTADRPGYELPDFSEHAAVMSPAAIERLRAHVLVTPRIEISASDVRQRVGAGQSIRYLVPDGVAAYIAQVGVYRVGGAPG